MSDQSEFVKIPLIELIPKFNTLVRDKLQVKLWQKGGQSIRHRPLEFENKKPALLHFFLEEDFAINAKEKVYYTFRLGGIDYFGLGMPIIENEVFKLRLAAEVYRSEKRGQERLLTFPHHQVYLYAHFPAAKDKYRGEAEANNVISLDGFRKPLKVLKREVVTDPVKNFIKKVLDDEQDFLGYRVLDLSTGGGAFLVNQTEKELFERGKTLNAKLLYDRQTFELNEIKIVYLVDSLTGSSKGNPLFKVGVAFKQNEELSQLVQRKLEESSAKDGTQQDFEDFLED